MPFKIPFSEIPCGFIFGAAKVQRYFSDRHRGWITISIETPKFKAGKEIQIYVTKTGKVIIHDSRGEWKSP